MPPDAEGPRSSNVFEVVETSRRYVLGEAADGYEIWDEQTGDELVERFPLTDEGLDLALEHFSELRRRDRRERWNLYRLVWIATMAGAVVWLLAGTLATLFFTVGIGQSGPWITGLLYGLDSLGYRLAIGSLVVLAVLFLLRQFPAPKSTLPIIGGSSEGPPSRRWDLVLRFVLVAGLAVWIVSAVATEALFRFELEPLGPNPTKAAVAAQLVSTVAFRAWVAALVLLVVRRLRVQRTVLTTPGAST